MLAEEYQKRILQKSSYEIDFSKLVEYVLEVYYRVYSTMPRNVLELGPGAGEVVKEFSIRGIDTSALEISHKMALLTQENSPNTHIFEGDIINVEDITDGKFDIIFAGAFLHLFSMDQEKIVLEKIAKWLSAKSAFFMYTTLHEKSSEGFEIKSDYKTQIKRFRRRWKKTDLLSFLNEQGFEVVDYFINDEIDRNKTWINIVSIKKRKTHKDSSL